MRLDLQEQHEMTNEFLEGGFNETQSGTLTSVLGKLLERQEAIFNKFREDFRSDIENMRQEDRQERERLRKEDRQDWERLRKEDREDWERFRMDIKQDLERVRNEDKQERIRMREEDDARFERIEASVTNLRASIESMQRWVVSTLTALVAAGILGGFGALYALVP